MATMARVGLAAAAPKQEEEAKQEEEEDQEEELQAAAGWTWATPRSRKGARHGVAWRL